MLLQSCFSKTRIRKLLPGNISYNSAQQCMVCQERLPVFVGWWGLGKLFDLDLGITLGPGKQCKTTLQEVCTC